MMIISFDTFVDAADLVSVGLDHDDSVGERGGQHGCEGGLVHIEKPTRAQPPAKAETFKN